MAGATDWIEGRSPPFSAAEWEWIEARVRKHRSKALDDAAALVEQGAGGPSPLADRIRHMKRGEGDLPKLEPK